MNAVVVTVAINLVNGKNQETDIFGLSDVNANATLYYETAKYGGRISANYRSDYLIDIIGKNHDTYTAGGKAPLTFQLHDCYADTKQMNSSDTSRSGWTSCAMRQTHLPAISASPHSENAAAVRMASMPSDI